MVSELKVPGHRLKGRMQEMGSEKKGATVSTTVEYFKSEHRYFYAATWSLDVVREMLFCYDLIWLCFGVSTRLRSHR